MVSFDLEIGKAMNSIEKKINRQTNKLNQEYSTQKWSKKMEYIFVNIQIIHTNQKIQTHILNHLLQLISTA